MTLLCFLTALSCSPSQPLDENARYRQGQVFYAEGDYTRAAEAFQACLDQGYKDRDLYVLIGKCSFFSGSYLDAVVYFTQAHEADTAYLPAGLWLARAHLVNGTAQKEMTALLESYRKTTPNHPALLILQGQYREAGGDLQGARACYEQALIYDKELEALRKRVSDLGRVLRPDSPKPRAAADRD